VRPLDAWEIAALTKTISGGNRKKTQDLIDMKRKEKRNNLKGGQMASGPYPTSPTSPTAYSYLSATGTNPQIDEAVVGAFDRCESTHYSQGSRNSRSGTGSTQVFNTDTSRDIARLRNCVGSSLINSYASKGISQSVTGAPPMPGPCTTSWGVRVACPPSAIGVPETDATSSIPQGGAKRRSRKNKSRSLKSKISRLSMNKLGSSSRNMARKSSRRSSRRASTRKATRNGSRKTRRSNRK
jgi:hypothetical protein